MSDYFSIEDEDLALVKRFEEYLSGDASGYFDVEELVQMAHYYTDRLMFEKTLIVVSLGETIHPQSCTPLYLHKAIAEFFMEEIEKAYHTIKLIKSYSDEEEMVKGIFLHMHILISLNLQQELQALVQKIVDEKTLYPTEVFSKVAFLYTQANEYDKAIEWLQKGVDTVKDSIELLGDLGGCLSKVGRNQEAIQVLEKAISLSPYYDLAWMLLGEVYVETASYDKALECFEFVIVTTTEKELSTLATYRKGDMLFELNRWKEARESYMEIEEDYSDKYDLYFLIAECYEYEEKFTQALRYYQQALSHQISNEEKKEEEELLLKIAFCHLELTAYLEATFCCAKILEMNENSFSAWVYYGEALIQLERTKEAVEAFEKAISITPNHPPLLMHIGKIYYEFEAYDIAKKYFKQAYRYDQTLENIELLLAVTHFFTEEYAEVSKFLELAINRNLDAEKMFEELCHKTITLPETHL